ncbi:MAG: Rrf2 family transcriptional regulator [Candidatus Omnitrophica bacterium]|nr:Rrf2 family transcriptional regulator [Candidatus Omnitrophota bacterium]
MVKIYSKGCEYALRVLTRIPLNTPDQKFLAVDLCRQARVPIHSSRKALQLLVEHQYLEAVPGPGGGYKLKRSPAKITLLDIIETIDGEDTFRQCIMGMPQCGGHNPCSLHAAWSRMKDGMVKEMRSKTLKQLMESTQRKRNIKP